MPSSRCALILVPITWAILASTLCAPLFSQVPDPLQVDKSVFASLSDHFATSPDTVIILLDPATSSNDWTETPPAPLSPRLSTLVDQVPVDRAIFTRPQQQASSVYSTLVCEALWGELILDKLQQQAQTAANKLLYRDNAQTPTSAVVCPIFCTSWIVSVARLSLHMSRRRLGRGEVGSVLCFPLLHTLS